MVSFGDVLKTPATPSKYSADICNTSGVCIMVLFRVTANVSVNTTTCSVMFSMDSCMECKNHE